MKPRLLGKDDDELRRHYNENPDWLTGNPNYTKAQRRRLRRGARGLCQHCNNPPVEGRVMCAVHLEQQKVRAAKAKAKKDEHCMETYGMSAWRLRRLRRRSRLAQYAIVIG